MKRRKQKDEAPRSGGELMTIIAHFRLLARFALIGRLSCHPRRAALVHDRTSPKLPERTAHRGLSFEEPKVSHAPLVESGDGILASSRYLSPCPSSHCLVLFCSWPDFLFITIDASRPTRSKMSRLGGRDKRYAPLEEEIMHWHSSPPSQSCRLFSTLSRVKIISV